MKVIFVFEVDEQDDVDRLAVDLISHHLINSVKYVPESELYDEVERILHQNPETAAYDDQVGRIVSVLLDGPDGG